MRLRVTVLRLLILWIIAIQGRAVFALAAAITVNGEAAQSRQGEFIDQQCGTRRKCNETPERKQIKEALMARLQAYRDFKEKQTFIGPRKADSPEDSELRLKMRDDEDYRLWWYEFRKPNPNPSVLFKYEYVLQNTYGSKIAPKIHHTLPFWRPLPQPAARK